MIQNILHDPFPHSYGFVDPEDLTKLLKASRGLNTGEGELSLSTPVLILSLEGGWVLAAWLIWKLMIIAGPVVLGMMETGNSRRSARIGGGVQRGFWGRLDGRRAALRGEVEGRGLTFGDFTMRRQPPPAYFLNNNPPLLSRSDLSVGTERDFDVSSEAVLDNRRFHGLGDFSGEVFFSALLADAGGNIVENIQLSFPPQIGFGFLCLDDSTAERAVAVFMVSHLNSPSFHKSESNITGDGSGVKKSEFVLSSSRVVIGNFKKGNSELSIETVLSFPFEGWGNMMFLFGVVMAVINIKNEGSLELIKEESLKGGRDSFPQWVDLYEIYLRRMWAEINPLTVVDFGIGLAEDRISPPPTFLKIRKLLPQEVQLIGLDKSLEVLNNGQHYLTVHNVLNTQIVESSFAVWNRLEIQEADFIFAMHSLYLYEGSLEALGLLGGILRDGGYILSGQMDSSFLYQRQGQYLIPREYNFVFPLEEMRRKDFGFTATAFEYLENHLGYPVFSKKLTLPDRWGVYLEDFLKEMVSVMIERRLFFLSLPAYFFAIQESLLSKGYQVHCEKNGLLTVKLDANGYPILASSTETTALSLLFEGWWVLAAGLVWKLIAIAGMGIVLMMEMGGSFSNDGMPYDPQPYREDIHRTLSPASIDDFAEVIEFIASHFGPHWPEAVSMAGAHLYNPSRRESISRMVRAGMPISRIADFLHYEEFDGMVRFENFPDWFQNIIFTHAQRTGIDRHWLDVIWGYFANYDPRGQEASGHLRRLGDMKYLSLWKEKVILIVKEKVESLGDQFTEETLIDLIRFYYQDKRKIPEIYSTVGYGTGNAQPADWELSLDETLFEGRLKPPRIIFAIKKIGRDGFYLVVWLNDKELENQLFRYFKIRGPIMISSSFMEVNSVDRLLKVEWLQVWIVGLGRLPRTLQNALGSAIRLAMTTETALRAFAQEEGIRQIWVSTGSQLFQSTRPPIHIQTIANHNDLFYKRAPGYRLRFDDGQWWWMLDLEENPPSVTLQHASLIIPLASFNWLGVAAVLIFLGWLNSRCSARISGGLQRDILGRLTGWGQGGVCDWTAIPALPPFVLFNLICDVWRGSDPSLEGQTQQYTTPKQSALQQSFYLPPSWSVRIIIPNTMRIDNTLHRTIRVNVASWGRKSVANKDTNKKFEKLEQYFAISSLRLVFKKLAIDKLPYLSGEVNQGQGRLILEKESRGILRGNFCGKRKQIITRNCISQALVLNAQGRGLTPARQLFFQLAGGFGDLTRRQPPPAVIKFSIYEFLFFMNANGIGPVEIDPGSEQVQEDILGAYGAMFFVMSAFIAWIFVRELIELFQYLNKDQADQFMWTLQGASHTIEDSKKEKYYLEIHPVGFPYNWEIQVFKTPQMNIGLVVLDFRKLPDGSIELTIDRAAFLEEYQQRSIYKKVLNLVLESARINHQKIGLWTSDCMNIPTLLQLKEIVDYTRRQETKDQYLEYEERFKKAHFMMRQVEEETADFDQAIQALSFYIHCLSEYLIVHIQRENFLVFVDGEERVAIPGLSPKDTVLGGIRVALGFLDNYFTVKEGKIFLLQLKSRLFARETTEIDPRGNKAQEDTPYLFIASPQESPLILILLAFSVLTAGMARVGDSQGFFTPEERLTIARAAIHLVRQLRARGVEVILMSGGSAPLPLMLFETAREKLEQFDGSSWMPEVYVLRTLHIPLWNIKTTQFYKPEYDSIPNIKELRQNMIKEAIGDWTEEGLQRIKRMDVAFVDDGAILFGKFKSIQSLYRELGFCNLIFAAFIPMPNKLTTGEYFVGAQMHEVFVRKFLRKFAEGISGRLSSPELEQNLIDYELIQLEQTIRSLDLSSELSQNSMLGWAPEGWLGILGMMAVLMMSVVRINNDSNEVDRIRGRPDSGVTVFLRRPMVPPFDNRYNQPHHDSEDTKPDRGNFKRCHNLSSFNILPVSYRRVRLVIFYFSVGSLQYLQQVVNEKFLVATLSSRKKISEFAKRFRGEQTIRSLDLSSDSPQTFMIGWVPQGWLWILGMMGVLMVSVFGDEKYKMNEHSRRFQGRQGRKDIEDKLSTKTDFFENDFFQRIFGILVPPQIVGSDQEFQSRPDGLGCRNPPQFLRPDAGW